MPQRDIITMATRHCNHELPEATHSNIEDNENVFQSTTWLCYTTPKLAKQQELFFFSART